MESLSGKKQGVHHIGEKTNTLKNHKIYIKK